MTTTGYETKSTLIMTGKVEKLLNYKIFEVEISPFFFHPSNQSCEKILFRVKAKIIIFHRFSQICAADHTLAIRNTSDKKIAIVHEQ
mgnify:CR=1 FL=1